jgi:hypothetical protein
VTRQVALIAVLGSLSASGCASTWETLGSRRFRESPYNTLFKSEDPLQVLRTNPDGEARARAMRELKEPATVGHSTLEQNEVMEMLTKDATSDPSPWVRMAAIDTLGRFKDPRAVEALTTAYRQATGRDDPKPLPPVQQVAAGKGAPLRDRGILGDRLGLHGPQGFPADQVANIRGQALDALAKTGHPHALEFVTRVATGEEAPTEADPLARDFVRQRAVASLGRIRQKDSVVALAKVLSAAHGKDIALAQMAHRELVDLTGQHLEEDPAKWNGVVQAGFEIAPEANWIERAIRFE